MKQSRKTVPPHSKYPHVLGVLLPSPKLFVGTTIKYEKKQVKIVLEANFTGKNSFLHKIEKRFKC